MANRILLSDSENEYFLRTVPYYLNDLGVREFTNIAKTMKHLSSEYNFSILTDEEIVTVLSLIQIEEYADWIDVIIFLTGNYDAIEKSILNRLEEIKIFKEYKLLIYSGTILSSKGNKNGVALFELASESKVAFSNSNRLTALHRLAVTELKRFKNYTRAKEIIRSILNENMGDLTEQIMISALVNNLYALLLIYEEKDSWQTLNIEIIMRNAQLFSEILVNTDDVDPVIKDQGVRYLSQININIAQVLYKQNKIYEAIELLENNRGFIAKNSQYYLSEALGVLGYFYFLNGQYEKVIPVIEEAKTLHIREGEYDAIIFDEQLLTVSRFKLKK